MPRETRDVPIRIEHLSILDPDGTVDDELVPDLPADELLRFHRAMTLARRFDERRLSLQREGHIGTFAPVNGQEAAQVGAASALGEDDWIVPAFRETAAAVWRGVPLEGILLYDAGFNEGGEVPGELRWLPNAVPVATQLPHAAGIAYGIRYRGDGAVVMAFCGDGATSEGDFHEALNFAGVFGCPVVFVVQNNQWAISTPRERQTESATLAQKAIAAGIPGIQVDGNDVLAVRVAADEAAERARAGEGPSVIECVTYRMSVHTTADDPSVYRDEEEVEEWAGKDPIDRLRTWLAARGLLSDEDVESVEAEVEEEVDAAWERTRERIGELEEKPLEMFEHLHAERPPYLERQRRALAEELGVDLDGADTGAGGEAAEAADGGGEGMDSDG